MADHHAEAAHAPRSFIRRYIFSTDHKVIGIQYIVTAVLMAIVGGTLAMLIRMQLAWPTETWPLIGKVLSGGMPGGVMLPDFYLSLVTMHGTIMVFFVVSLGLVSGFGNYLVPLQIGARDMAFPVLNMLSYWVIVPGCLLLLASFFVEGGAAAAGWTAYPPLSAVPDAVPGSGMGQTLWLLAMALFIVSFTLSGLNIVATVINLRTKGMSMLRMPMTVWTYFVSAIIGLISFPPLTAAAVMLLFDRHFDTSFFLPAGLFIGGKVLTHQGGSPLLWQHLFWFLGHPEVYVLILPAWGIALDLIPTFARKPLWGYKTVVWSLFILAVLSVIVWGHHMFVSGMNPYLGKFFSIGTMLVTLPSTVIGVSMMASLWGGNLKLTTPMLFMLGLIALFGTGGMGGLFLGNATSDAYLHDSYFVVGHFHYMIGGVTLMGLFGAVYYWFPKMFGKMLNDRLGKLHFWFTLVPFATVFFLQHLLGLGGMPRRYYAFNKYQFLEPLQDWNVVITITAFVLGAAQLIFIYNFFRSIFRGEKATENPWNATTLEWAAASPPPHLNWGAELPVVYRGPYDFSMPGAARDFIPQNEPDPGGIESESRVGTPPTPSVATA